MSEKFYGDPLERFRLMAETGGDQLADRAHFRMWCGIAADEIEAHRKERDAALARAEAAEAEVERLRDALQPFADFADEMTIDWRAISRGFIRRSDGKSVDYILTWQEFFAARAAIQAKEKETSEATND